MYIVDIETEGLDRNKHNINYIGVLEVNSSNPANIAYSCDIIENIYTDITKRKINKIFNLNKDKKIILHNLKFDILFLMQYFNIEMDNLHNLCEDTMLMSVAYDITNSHSLKNLAEKYLNVKKWDIDNNKKIKKSDDTIKYLKHDLYYTYLLYDFFNKNMNNKHKLLYNNLLKKAQFAYINIEKSGIYIDIEHYNKLKNEYKNKSDQLLNKLKKISDINWNSSQQVGEFLYDKNNINPVKYSKKTRKPSCDAVSLKKISRENDIAKLLLGYKKYNSIVTKFLTRWELYIYNSRIFASYNLANTISGRTSCNNPNLQQVPRDSNIRKCFTAMEGNTLLEVDYSQIELRIIAELACETTMLEIFSRNGDIHTATAKILSKSKEITKEDRSNAKVVNFGFVYGMGVNTFIDYAFASYDKIYTIEEATLFRHKFFQKYTKLQYYYKTTEDLCKKLGGIYTIFNRFIKLPDIYSKDKKLFYSAIRKACNYRVQSAASDLLLCSLIELISYISNNDKIKIVATVHDSILLEVANNLVDYTKNLINQVMLNPKILKDFGIKLKVPLQVNIKETWG